MLLAVVLSGVAPGAGHAYVGRPARGTLWFSLLALASVAWILCVPVSRVAATAGVLPLLVLILAMLADSVRLARRAPVPFPRARWQTWWVYALVVFASGFLAPIALAEAMAARVALVSVPDDALAPAVFAGDVVVTDRRVDVHGLRRGDVVLIAPMGATRGSAARRGPARRLRGDPARRRRGGRNRMGR